VSYTSDQLVQHYAENRQAASKLADAWKETANATEASKQEVLRQLQTARFELAAVYLLSFDAAALKRAERLTGFRGFTRRDPIRAMAHERVVLANTVKRIEADERWQRRQYLVGPAGELTGALAEAQSLLEPWELECKKFEDLDGFLDLIQVGYDTPAFEEHWYQAKYWKHWAAGDRICTSLELNDFGDDVLPAYERVRQPREQWRGEVAAANTKIDEVHNLVRTRDQAEARTPQLPVIYLGQARQVLAEFFGHADLGLLEEWNDTSDADRGVQQHLRRCAGLQAKLDFLTEMLDQGITAKIRDFEQRTAKYDRKRIKYLRSKYAYVQFHDRDLDLGFRRKHAKYQSQPTKLAHQVNKLMRYDDYGRFDLANDPELWWVEFTGKGPSSNTPRLRAWYERNPQAAPELDPEHVEEVVSQAAASWDRDDRGYLS
jgi:hypothetical protein